MYGLDLPTGGYFFTEFWKDEEIVGEEEVKSNMESLTLTELQIRMKDQYGFDIPIDDLVQDWYYAEQPTPMQFQVNRMFGKDLQQMLNRAYNDFVEHYT